MSRVQLGLITDILYNTLGVDSPFTCFQNADYHIMQVFCSLMMCYNIQCEAFDYQHLVWFLWYCNYDILQPRVSISKPPPTPHQAFTPWQLQGEITDIIVNLLCWICLSCMIKLLRPSQHTTHWEFHSYYELLKCLKCRSVMAKKSGQSVWITQVGVLVPVSYWQRGKIDRRKVLQQMT